MSMKNSNFRIGSRTRVLPVCGAVPQPIAFSENIPQNKTTHVLRFLYSTCKIGGVEPRPER